MGNFSHSFESYPKQSIEDTILSLMPLSSQSKETAPAKRSSSGETESLRQPSVPSNKQDQATSTSAQDHKIAIDAIKAFEKLDRDGNKYLTRMEIENATQDPTLNSNELVAAKFMANNYSDLSLMNKDPMDRYYALISRDDLQVFGKITRPGFSPIVSSAWEAANRNQLGLGTAGLWGVSSYFWAISGHPIVSITTGLAGATTLLKPATDFYNNMQNYSRLEGLRQKMVLP